MAKVWPIAVTEDSSATATYGRCNKRTVRTELVEVQDIVRPNEASCDQPRDARILAALLEIVRRCPSTGSGRTVLVTVFGNNKNDGTLRSASSAFSDCCAIKITTQRTPKA